MSIAEKLLTAEEYLQQPERHRQTELVQGVIIEISPTSDDHARVCGNIARILAVYLESNDTGTLLTGDGGVLTGRNPDTLRGADIAFYRYDNAPDGRSETTLWRQAPDVVIEVHSPGVSWKSDLEMVSEYLKAGVRVVCLADFERQRVEVFRNEAASVVYDGSDQVSLPEVGPEFLMPLEKVFLWTRWHS